MGYIIICTGDKTKAYVLIWAMSIITETSDVWQSKIMIVCWLNVGFANDFGNLKSNETLIEFLSLYRISFE